MSACKTLKLSNGAEMPILGYGTWLSKEEELEPALECALATGYRHIDTAFLYKNEKVIGRVLKRWLDAKKVKREDLFITTKLPNTGNRPSDVEYFLDKSLSNLQLDYVDLYLIHLPFGLANRDDETMFPTTADNMADLDLTTDLQAIWKKMEEMVDKGKTRAIGVSNFNIKQIEKILKVARIRPVTNQVELHVYHQQRELHEFAKKENMTLTSYSSLGSPGTMVFMGGMGIKAEFPSLLTHPEVKAIAAESNKLPAQVLLRFVIQSGIAAIPKSINPERIKQNFDIFDFELSPNQMSRLIALDKKTKFIDFSLVYKGVTKHPEYPY